MRLVLKVKMPFLVWQLPHCDTMRLILFSVFYGVANSFCRSFKHCKNAILCFFVFSSVFVIKCDFRKKRVKNVYEFSYILFSTSTARSSSRGYRCEYVFHVISILE